MAKDCPTPEVKGNLKGGGKGYGDKGKSYAAKGYPGKGVKGETRECYNCGKKGHLSQDCWAKGGGKGKGKAVAEVGIEEVNESGEIWAIMQVDKLEISEVEKKKAADEKISCYNRCYNRYKDDDSDSDDEEEESSVTFIGSKCQSLFSQLGESVKEDGSPTMLKSADSSDDEEEDPVTVEDTTEEESTLLDVPPGIVNWEKLQVLQELEEWAQLEEEEDFDFEEDDDDTVIAEVFEVNAVYAEKKYVKIAIDSAAAESVCPPDWASEFKVTPCQEGQEQKFVNASGGNIKHFGQKRVALDNPSGGRVIGMPFQACEVKRPLASVRRICEKGNVVQFGPGVADNFILNVKTREKIWLKQERGQYIMEASLATDSPF